MTERGEDARMLFSAVTHYRRWMTQLIPLVVPDVDVSYQQVNVLYLIRTEDASMADMARLLGVAPTVITGLVDRLEARDLVRREAHASDRRRIQLALTERGHEISVRVQEAIILRIEQQVELLTPAELEQLQAGLGLFERLSIDLEAGVTPGRQA